jgi:3-dehydroquinate synthase
MITVPVSIPGARYDIVVHSGLLDAVGQRVRQILPTDRAAVITDSNLVQHHLPALERALREARFEPIALTIPAGEQYKTLSMLEPIYERLVEARAERTTPIIALGGGVIGDLAGFVAATFLRGLPFVQVPTSLLAMVDASIGGKTAVNLPRAGKNFVGAFHQPRIVLIDPQVLRTLPPAELRNGLAECIKHQLIRDAEGFARLERNVERALQLEVGYLTELVGQNAAIKARVVEADPFERGERAHLNFGHTFGHAIEWASKYTVAHGEAVALGMVASSFVSTRLGMLDTGVHQRIVNLISRAGLPTRGVQAPPDLLFEAMRRDKKIAAGKARFVLLDRVGHAIIRDDVPEAVVHQAIDAIR